MKSSWTGIGFSHHSVPSLSNTATRSATGTGSAPSAPQTCSTKPITASRAAPSCQLASGSGMSAPPLSVRDFSAPTEPTRPSRRLTPGG